MATTQKFDSVKFDGIYVDYSRNFRQPGSYSECEAIKGFDPSKDSAKANLYHAIYSDGLQTPLMLAKLSADEAEELSRQEGRRVTHRVIRGHRRAKAITNIRHDHPHMLETVPAIVVSGLSLADEVGLMADQGHVQDLNKYELLKAIRTLNLNTRLSEEAIGSRLGVSRGVVQRLKYVFELPDVVEENFRKRFERDAEGKTVPHVQFTDAQLNELNKAANRDRTAGVDPSAEGSQFMAMWNGLAATGEAGGKEPKALTRKDMLARAQLVRDPIAKGIIRICAGEEGNLEELSSQLIALRDRVMMLEAQAEYAAAKAEPVTV